MIWFICKFWLFASNFLYSYSWKTLCAPVDLSEIGSIVVSTCIPVAWELLGECPRNLGKWGSGAAHLPHSGERAVSSFSSCLSSSLRAEMLGPAWGLVSFSHLLCRYWWDELPVLSQILAALIWNPGTSAALVQWVSCQDMWLCHKTEMLFFSGSVAWVSNSYKNQEWVTLWTDPKIYPKNGIQDSWKKVTPSRSLSLLWLFKPPHESSPFLRGGCSGRLGNVFGKE